MKKTILLALSALTLTFTNCKKGDTGTKGDTGATGPTGATGQTGTQGPAGNANVIGTNSVQLNASNWSANGSFYLAQINATSITQQILDKGLIMVYEQDGNYWMALPYSLGGLNRTFEMGLGNVVIYYQNTAGATSNPGNKVYRIVIISASKMAAHPNTNYRDYNEVMKIFGTE